MSNDFAAEFYGLPTYFITTARAETVGHNIRVYHWEKRGSILAPQFIAVLSAYDLTVINREVHDAATQCLMDYIPRTGTAH